MVAFDSSAAVNFFCEYEGRNDVVAIVEATLTLMLSETQFPTMLPTTSFNPTVSSKPTGEPTFLETSEPTLINVPAGNLGCSESPASTPFKSIANSSDTVRLNGLSNSDDSTQQVQLPFEFPWFSTTLTRVVVSSNGQINMDGRFIDNCCSADKISPNSNYNGERVAIAQEDLNPSRGGDIFVLEKTSSVVISFEGVPFFSSQGEVNAQVELFEDGEIELRWGTGFMAGQSMAAGVQSDAEEVYAPVTTAGGANFSDGVTSSWPGNDGVAFFCGTLPTVAPTSPHPTVSEQPTLSHAPTLVPTEFTPIRKLVLTALCVSSPCSASARFEIPEYELVISSASVSIVAGGDLGSSSEFLSITIGGDRVGTCGEFGDDCNDPLQACLANIDVLDEVVSSGAVTVAFNTSEFVDNFCDYEGEVDVAGIIEATLTLVLSETQFPTMLPTTSFSPTVSTIPTGEPTFLETSEPTLISAPAGDLDCAESPASTPFESIANLSHALRLDSISNSDDRTQQVQLPFEFPWFSSTLTRIVVSSNGQINMDGSFDDNCCSADKISPNSTYNGEFASRLHRRTSILHEVETSSSSKRLRPSSSASRACHSFRARVK